MLPSAKMWMAFICEEIGFALATFAVWLAANRENKIETAIAVMNFLVSIAIE
jgi:hypothetical protein